MKIAWIGLLLFAGGAAAEAQNILMKDGSVVATKGIVRRSGDLILARVERQAPAAGQGTAPAKIDEGNPPSVALPAMMIVHNVTSRSKLASFTRPFRAVAMDKILDAITTEDIMK